jgi:ectoine hydroxylase-related dioxygenase (phytanoyl-CoA dioxygenase family)
VATRSSTMQDALENLGVRPDTLTQQEKDQLDHDGFLPLSGILKPEHLGSLRDRVYELLQAEGDQAGIEVHQEAGTERLSDLVNKGAVFDICFTHPRVLAAMAHVLAADFKLSSLNYRAALPGQGHQALHTDWREPVTAGEFRVCNSIWLLDDFTAENGPTRVVPGSHLRGTLPKDEMPDPAAPHRNERMLLAPAGTVVIFNSHLWHGGTLNRTAAQRRALHSYFCRRTERQQLDQQRYARAETRARLSPAARYVLGIDGV